MLVTDPDISRPRLIRVLGRFPQQSCLDIESEVGGLATLYSAFLQESGQYLYLVGALSVLAVIWAMLNARRQKKTG